MFLSFQIINVHFPCSNNRGSCLEGACLGTSFFNVMIGSHLGSCVVTLLHRLSVASIDSRAKHGPLMLPSGSWSGARLE